MTKQMTEFDRENLIRDIALSMIEYDWRLMDLVSNFGYSLTRIYTWITGDLKYIDSDLYGQCRRVMDRHKSERIPRGRRY